MNKESMGGSCLSLYQFVFRVIGGIAMCHSRKEYYKNERNKLYYIEICIVIVNFCKSSPPTTYRFLNWIFLIHV